MAEAPLATRVSSYYEMRLNEFGPVPQGVDWKDDAAQQIRFEQLISILDGRNDLSVLDVGCGYGALLQFLRARGYSNAYTGVDFSPAMIEAADLRSSDSCARFQVGAAPLLPHSQQAGIVVASGVFNVRAGISDTEWERHILVTLEAMNRLSSYGFAFNCLGPLTQPDRRRMDLYYGQPEFFIEHLTRTCPGNLELLNHYGLHDFTIFVRKS